MSAADPVPWFEEWFDRDYLLVYAHRDARDARPGVELLCRVLAPPPGARLLDLGCGPGRHLAHLLEAGLRPTGLDRSRVLLLEAVKATSGRAPLVRADMRALPLRDARFQIVASFFTSFGYFDDAGNRATLAEAARVLAPGGAFFLDYLNREHALAHLAPERRVSRGSTFVIEARRYDPATRRLIKEIEIQEESETRRRHESVRLYAPGEVEELFRGLGLEPETRFGDLHGRPFDPARSPRLVLVGRRR